MAWSLRLLLILVFVAGVALQITKAATTIAKPPEPVTTKPPATTTAKPPEPATTTAKPPEPVTTKPPATTTAKPPEPVTTKPPATTTTNITEPTTATTTKFPGACASQPCGRGSTCEERANQTYACLCLTGDYYNYTLNLCVAATSLCETEPCDTKTTTCENGTNGTFTCKCRKEYVQTDFSDRSCAACSNGYKAVDGICEPCDFGFSGFNCGDRWQLDLVIVGSVLGALLLIALILLPVVAVVSKKKSNKKPKNMDYEKSYSNPATAKPPQALNGFAGSRPTSVQAIAANGMPRIPRATTADSWDRNTNLEMMPSNSRQNLVPVGQNSRRYDDQEDMGRSAYNRPTRPQNNPYAVSRPQANPYASKQGQSNPYYSHDDERSYR